jgi:hypothetical protein
MRANTSKAGLIRSGLAASFLLLASGLPLAQTVNLTAAPTHAVLPDGQSVPMWGYSCTGTPTGATCAAANPNAAGNWSPVVITVPYTADSSGNSTTSLTINLTNNLSFTTSGAPNTIPTSLVIVGQLGGGLGGTPRPSAPTARRPSCRACSRSQPRCPPVQPVARLPVCQHSPGTTSGPAPT